MKEILDYTLWGNTMAAYGLVLLGILVARLLLLVLKHRLFKYLKKMVSKSNTKLDDLLLDGLFRFLVPYLYLVISCHIVKQLHLSQKVEKGIDAGLVVISVYYGIRFLNFILHKAMVMYMEEKNEPLARIKQIEGMLLGGKLVIWSLGLILLADNLGYHIGAIITGLGVGGIAIALAAQNILGDVFSYIVIFFDKPFEIGDFISAGNNSGVVERIGIKTTHLRSLDGQQLILPNTDMVKSVIQNYKRLQRRRVVFSIGVEYSTPSEKLRAIPTIIKEIITTQKEKTSFDRAHFKSFGDFSINYEVVYYVESADYVLYMDLHHEICMDINERFAKENIGFAFPTQTIFVNH
jgi:small-conductance mechanosensitive channel